MVTMFDKRFLSNLSRMVGCGGVGGGLAVWDGSLVKSVHVEVHLIIRFWSSTWSFEAPSSALRIVINRRVCHHHPHHSASVPPFDLSVHYFLPPLVLPVNHFPQWVQNASEVALAAISSVAGAWL